MKFETKIKVMYLLSAALIASGVFWVMIYYGFFGSDVYGNKVKTIGKVYYEQIYYPNNMKGLSTDQVQPINEDRYDNKISINLTELSLLEDPTLNQYLDEVKMNDEFKGCNFDNTVIKITPTVPYNIENYDIEVQLDCSKK